MYNQREPWLLGARLVKGTPLSTILFKHALRRDGVVTRVAKHALHEEARVVGATAEAAAVLDGAGAQQSVTAGALRGRGHWVRMGGAAGRGVARRSGRREWAGRRAKQRGAGESARRDRM